MFGSDSQKKEPSIATRRSRSGILLKVPVRLIALWFCEVFFVRNKGAKTTFAQVCRTQGRQVQGGYTFFLLIRIVQ